jgi:NADH-quinone oxidoreductase subunit E
MALSTQTREKILQLKKRYPDRRSALGPSLYLLQAEQGYCSDEGMEEVAALLDLVPADVFSTASFYTMFYKEPSGRKVVDVCTNLACMVNGSDDILDYISKRTNTPVNGTSPDGRMMLRHVECLGYCDKAPLLEVDYRPFGPLTREIVDQILAEENLLPDSGPVENGIAESSVDLSGTRIYGTGKPRA